MRILLLSFVLLALSRFAAAQIPQFHTFNLGERRENISVLSMLQDRDGFLWFGSAKGIHRFDGRQFSLFREDSVQTSPVTALAEDANGTLWVGHEDGSITTLRGNRFDKFSPSEGSASEKITDILIDRKGVLWFSTAGDGLYYYVNKRLYRVDDQEGLPDLFIYDLSENKAGEVIVASDGGIAFCSLKDNKIGVHVVDDRLGLPDNIVKQVYELDSGVYLLGTEDHGLIRYNRKESTFTRLIKDWGYGSIAAFAYKNGRTWIAAPKAGLVVFDHDSGQYKIYSNVDVEALTTASTIAVDAEGNIWIGCKTGLLRTPGDILEYFPKYDPRGRDNILAITFDQGHRMWFSNGRGLFLQTAESTFSNILQGTRYEKYRVISLYTDAFGYVWAGLYGEGVLRIDAFGKKLRLIQNELRNGNVLNITGSGDKVWLATLGGASEITLSGEKFTVKNYSSAEGLSSDFIYHVFIDQTKRVWFSTDGRGVDMLDETGFHHFEEGLPSKIVYAVSQDGAGRIWANVQNYGLHALEGNVFRRGEGFMGNENLMCATVDSRDRLIAVHESGIDVVDMATQHARHFGQQSGFGDRLANLNAIAFYENHYWIGTDDGIIRFSTHDINFESRPLPRIVQVTVYGNAVESTRLTRLSHDENNIAFQVTGLWYQDPEQVQYSYKLDNYDRDWITTRNNSIIYSKLPPGAYTFRLKASETDSFAHVQEKTVTIVIHPPFWRTPPFFMALFVVGIVTLYLYVKSREKKLTQDKMILEARVQRRTMEIQRQAEEIQAQNEEIMAQAEEIKGINENLELIVKQRTSELERKNVALEEYAFINAHKLRSPVASILGLVNLIEKTKLDDEGREISRLLQKSADELDDIVRSITKAIERGDRQFNVTLERDDDPKSSNQRNND